LYTAVKAVPADVVCTGVLMLKQLAQSRN